MPVLPDYRTQAKVHTKGIPQKFHNLHSSKVALRDTVTLILQSVSVDPVILKSVSASCLMKLSTSTATKNV